MKSFTILGNFARALALLVTLAGSSFAQTPTPAQPPVPPLHELLQAMKFPLAVPVPDKPDPLRLYKEAIDTIAKQHIALAGYAEPEATQVETMVNGWFGRPTKPRKSKMDAFLEKWGTPPRELKSLDDADVAIQEALKDLDFRFDSYLVPKDVKLEDKRIDNTNIGIGAILKLEAMQDLLKSLPKDATEEQVDKALVISEKNFLSANPVRNSPAAKGGMLNGDVIKEVAGKAILGMQYTEVMKLIKGKQGTKVDITIERVENGSKVTKKLTITRDEYEVPVVNLKHIGNDVWHLQLETFAARNAAKDVKEALDEVVKKGGKALIFDLRDNGGGLVDQAIDIAMYMLPEGTIVTQRHRLFGGTGVVETQSHVTKHVMLETRPQTNGQLPIIKPRVLAVPAEMPIVVLVNGHSASASELVSGALKFNKRAKLVGTRTFGKGVGQALLDLPYGRRLHVTSFYFLPDDQFTDWVGIDVDVESKLAEDAKKDTQLDDAVKVVTEMYENGVKERADTAKREEEIRKLNRELWKKRLERQKEMEEALKKKDEAKKNGAKEAPSSGTENGGKQEETTPMTKPEVVPTPAPAPLPEKEKNPETAPIPKPIDLPADPFADPNSAK